MERTFRCFSCEGLEKEIGSNLASKTWQNSLFSKTHAEIILDISSYVYLNPVPGSIRFHMVIQRRSSSSSSNRMTPTSPPPSKLKQNKFQQSPTQGPLSSPENSATPQDRQPWLGCHGDEPEPLNSGLELKQFVFIAHHVHYSYPMFASMEQPDTFWGLAVGIGVINLCNGPIRLQFRRPTTARCVTARAGPSADWVVTFPNGQMKEKQAASTFTWASVHIFGNRMGG